MSDSSLYQRSKGMDTHTNTGQRHKISVPPEARSALALDVGSGCGDMPDSASPLQDEVFEVGQLVPTVGLPVSRSSSSVSDVTTRENAVYYAGENGKIIVPKICIDGEYVFTTFEHIDTMSTDLKNSGPADTNGLISYEDKVVALEIAKEMALLERTVGDEQLTVSHDDIPDMFSKTLKKGPSPVPSPKLQTKATNQHSNTNGSHSDTAALNKGVSTSKPGANDTCSSSKRQAPSPPKMSLTLDKDITNISPPSPTVPKLSPRLGLRGMRTSQHKGSSMSYEELKNSIPDTCVSFHTDNVDVIYFNTKDEVTKL